MIFYLQNSGPLNETDHTSQLESIEDPHQINEFYSQYLKDESRISDGHAVRILFPKSENQIQKIIIQANKNRIPITISAGRTGIAGGAVPNGGWLLSLNKMNRIQRAEWDESTKIWNLTLEPGVSLDQLSGFLDSNGMTYVKNFEDRFGFLSLSHQWFYPPDPTEKTAHLGGTVATNASGSRSFHYGPTRNHVNGLRVLLSNGAILNLKRGETILRANDELHITGPLGELCLAIPHFQRKKIKNTAGYYLDDPMDLMDLFIGSEGTLGVVTEITVALTQKPDSIFGAISFFKMEGQALDFTKKIRQISWLENSHIRPISLEFFDSYALQLLRKHANNSRIIPVQAAAAIYFEQPFSDSNLDDVLVAYDRQLQECGTSMDETWGAWDSKALKEMNNFRHAVPEIINTIIGQRQRQYPRIHKVGTDFVVPASYFDEMMHFYRMELERSALESVIFGHIGENHVHVNILPHDEHELVQAKTITLMFARKVVELDGSVSGEHGIGKIKRNLFEIMYSDLELEKFKAVKKALDPNGFLSPGNLFSTL